MESTIDSDFIRGVNVNDMLSLEKALECPLCLTLICEPISTPCGHSFCRTCLIKALQRHSKKCPSCRSVCHVSAEDAPVNVMLKSVSIAINPTLYNTRQEEISKEIKSLNSLLPIFYYNQALFPGCKLALHLFEPRYKIMMQRIVHTSRSFAYVPNYSNYIASVGNVALIAKLEEVDFLEDGRCLLEAKISGRCTILESFEEKGTQGLHYCRLEPLVDDQINEDDLEIVRGYRSIASRILSVIFSQGIKVQIEERYGTEPSDISGFSLWITALAPLPEERKFELLNSKNTKERLEICVNSLAELIRPHAQPQSESEYAVDINNSVTLTVDNMEGEESD